MRIHDNVYLLCTQVNILKSRYLRYLCEDRRDHRELYASCQTVHMSQRWSQLTDLHPVTIDDWMNFELNVAEDFLPKAARMSYMKKSVSNFIEARKASDSYALIAKELFIKLVRPECQMTKVKPDFVKLLDQLLQNLPPRLGMDEVPLRPLWLTSCLALATDRHELSNMMKLSLNLPCHLFVCDTPDEVIKGQQKIRGQQQCEQILDNLRQMRLSSLTSCACLSLDATVYVLQVDKVYIL